jgi:predicted transcriptional regulator YheO
LKSKLPLDFLKHLAKGLAEHFGSNCEIVIHDLTVADKNSTIAAIENGHVSHRQVGDGPSHIVLEALKEDSAKLTDQLGYLSKTHDGRILRSSTIYIRDEANRVIGIFSINYDITGLLMAENALKVFTGSGLEAKEPEHIPQNVNQLLDDLINQSVALIGKPVALMTKEDKIQAIQYLNKAGAFLITKSGDKIAKHFNISKFTMYSYLEEGRSSACDDRMPGTDL